MKFHPAQSAIAKDRHRFRVACCGRKFGKTELAIWEMFGVAVAKNDRSVVYIAPTNQQARDIAWVRLKKICEPIATYVNESRLEIKVRTQDGGESGIALRGWEAVETQRGLGIDFYVIDEVAQMRDFFANWQEILRPNLTITKGGALFISTPKGFNHFYDLYNMEGSDVDFKSFHFTSYDNPYADREELETAKNQSNFEQEYMADFRKAEGLVYKEFDRDLHTYDDESLAKLNLGFAEVIAGVDFGFTHPSAILVIKKGYGGHFYVDDEWYRTGKTNKELIEMAKVLQSKYNINSFYPDPAEPQRIEEMQRAGLSCREVIKGQDSVTKGIDAVRAAIKENRLKVNKKCVNTIGEFESYSYQDETRVHSQKGQEKPEDANNHAMDALSYAIRMSSPIEPMAEYRQRQRIMQKRGDKSLMYE